MKYLRIWLIGAGTVFGTWGLIMLALSISTILSSDPYAALGDRLGMLFVYGFVGALLGGGICLALTIPLMLLWFPVFRAVIRAISKPQHAAMITAGLRSSFAAVGVLIWAQYVGAMRMPALAWPFVLIPVSIAVVLARFLFADSNEGAV